MVGGDAGRIVDRVEDQDQAALEAGPDHVDGLPAAGWREVDDDRVDGVGLQGRPGLDVDELGDPAGAVEQRSEGETQRRVTPQQHDMTGHLAGYYLAKASTMRMIAGPRITTNKAGKIQKSTGNRTLMGTFIARSSANWRRLIRMSLA
jgi:hypothetical protein